MVWLAICDRRFSLHSVYPVSLTIIQDFGLHGRGRLRLLGGKVQGPAPDTMTRPADTPIQPIRQARLELVLNELRHYWSEETVQTAAPLIEDLDLEIKSVTYIKPNEDEKMIDNGHGENTPGKRSPDERYREYKYNRVIARAVVEHLQLRGYDAQLLVPEEEDIPLGRGKECLFREYPVTCLAGSIPVDSHFIFKDSQVILDTCKVYVTKVGELLPTNGGGSSHDANHLCT